MRSLREAFLIRAELESLATEIAAKRMTRADLDELEAIEDRFAGLTDELRRGGRLAADRRAGLVTEWVPSESRLPRSSRVPRSLFSEASKRNIGIIQAPYSRFLSWPVVGSRSANSGGARWKVSL